MSELRFDTGVQSFQINGGVSVEFCPTDSDFAKKLWDLFEELEELLAGLDESGFHKA